jgi:hypothetical protein
MPREEATITQAAHVRRDDSAMPRDETQDHIRSFPIDTIKAF